MPPEKILRKENFRIPIPDPFMGFTRPGDPVTVLPVNNLKYKTVTQADFMREFNVNSHSINSIKYYPNNLFYDSNGKIQAKVHTRIAVAYQEMIKTKRKTALIGNNVGMRLISSRANSGGEDKLARFRDGWEESNMEIAVDRCIDSDFITGDCAVYVFLSGDNVGWRTFSFKDGDVLYPHYHPMTGELSLFGRLYHDDDNDGMETEYLDVIDGEEFITYRKERDKEEWTVEYGPVRHGFPFCPVAYHRRDTGPVWSASQSLIENYEMGISQFSENNLSYGLRILYTLGADFEMMSNPDGTPARIDSSSPDAKVGFLENATGGDGAFAKQLEILHKNIMRCSFTVEAPEIKSGADMSSLTVKMLFADSYLKALEDSQEYQLFLDRIVMMFKHAYGIASGESSLFNEFKVKPYLEPFIFMSETEVVNALVQLTAAGVLSKRTATEIAYNSGYGTASEWGRILQEAHDELVAEQTTTQTTKSNPVNESRNRQ